MPAGKTIRMNLPPRLLGAGLLGLLGALHPVLTAAVSDPGSRLAYLDRADPYYADESFPRLLTPQWVGEDGVDAVVVLAVDDLMDNAPRFEALLRPVLDRLKQLQGRAAVSIMAIRVAPDDPLVARWLAEGVNLDTHTHTHPCPLLHGGDLAAARWTYHHCVDQLSRVPGARPVAFRMPCLDIWNTTSPRFYREIFNQVSPEGRFLRLSSSVTVMFTADDPDLPRALVVDEDGRDRFAKYANQGAEVFGRAAYRYGNFVRNYPYPLIVAGRCWEIPMITSDNTMAIYRDRYGNRTLRDWQAAVDATVLKRGIVAFCFHTTGAIRPEELVALVDHAHARYGRRVRFLNFAEVDERLTRHLLAGQPLRAPDGDDNGVRVLDLDGDGHLDVVIGNEQLQRTRLWDAAAGRWRELPLPVRLVERDTAGRRRDAGVRFGVLRPDGAASLAVASDTQQGLWHFAGGRWVKDPAGLRGLPRGDRLTGQAGRDQGVRLRDLDGDGRGEWIAGHPDRRRVYAWTGRRWRETGARLPEAAAFVDAAGRDAGARLVDVNGDGRPDLVVSNERDFGVAFFRDLEHGWAPARFARRADAAGFALPPITRDGMDNGAWFDGANMWVVNEETDALNDHALILPLDRLREWVGAGPPAGARD